MEIEVRSFDAKTRPIMNEKLNGLKKSFGNIKVEYGIAQDKLKKTRLMGGKSGEQRQRLLNTNEKYAQY
jgi:hypothetical protein